MCCPVPSCSGERVSSPPCRRASTMRSSASRAGSAATAGGARCSCATSANGLCPRGTGPSRSAGTWAVTGEACGTSDLAWYLAINCERLPHSKEDAIAAYRDALERHGVTTSSWWDRAIALALLGAVVQFGWEKALAGPGPELGWWEDRAVEGLARL